LPLKRWSQVIVNNHELSIPYTMPPLMNMKASTYLVTNVMFMKTRIQSVEKSCKVGYGFIKILVNAIMRKPIM